MRINPNEIVKRLKLNHGLIRKTARDLKVSPSTVLNWKFRAQSLYSNWLRTTGLKRKSTVPKTTRHTDLPTQEQDAIVTLRRQTNFGAIKIAGLLNVSCHARTVHRFLLHKGLVNQHTGYRRPKLQPTIHMHARNTTGPGFLQMDVKYITPQLSGLSHTLFEYAIIDIFSRYKLGLIVPNLDMQASIAALRVLSSDLPFRASFLQTDNGLEFQSSFYVFVTQELGWHYHYIHKSTPNENAIIERSFRTDEEEFFGWRYHRAIDLHDLNNQFQAYLDFYNQERPHLSLNLMTPLEKLKAHPN